MTPARAVCSVLLGLALSMAPAGARKGPYVEGGRFPFALPDLRGRTVAAEDLKEKVLFVDLMGTWCQPCLTVVPTLVDLQERYGSEGLAVVSIAFEREEDPETRRAGLREFVEEHGINYTVLDGGSVDRFEEALPMMRNVRGFPVEVIVDREGNVVEARNGYGYKKRWARKLERKLTDLLRGPEE